MPHKNVRPPCAGEELAVAFLQGELSGPEHRKFADHAEDCFFCAEQVRQAEHILHQLHALGPHPPRHDLSPKIMGRIPQDAWQKHADAQARRKRKWRWAMAAAFFVLVVWGGQRFLPRLGELTSYGNHGITAPPAPQEHIRPSLQADSGLRHCQAVGKARAWLASVQEPEGCWNGAKWGGEGMYNVALTALAIQTFADGNGGPYDAEYTGTVRRGIRFLMQQQAQDGRFGPRTPGALYNHGMATVTILEFFGRHPSCELHTVMDHALDFICEAQSPDGGWGYLTPAGQPSNVAVSVWQLHALRIAVASGLDKARAPYRKGLDWVAGMVDAQGNVGYRRREDFPYGPDTLKVMGAFAFLETNRQVPLQKLFAALPLEPMQEIDYYRWYFLAHVLAVMPEQPSYAHLEYLRNTLLARQVTQGRLTGSWDPTDQWSATGGRVYSTAMAALVLQINRRTAHSAS